MISSSVLHVDHERSEAKVSHSVSRLVLYNNTHAQGTVYLGSVHSFIVMCIMSVDVHVPIAVNVP